MAVRWQCSRRGLTCGLWDRYRAAQDEEAAAAELQPRALAVFAAIVVGLLLLMGLVPPLQRFTGFTRLGPALGLFAVGFAASVAAGRLFARRALRDALLLVDTACYCALIVLLMHSTSAPCRYVFGLIYGQMAVDYGRRVAFSGLMFGAVGGIPVALALLAWPDFGVLALVGIGALFYAYTGLATARQRELARRARGLEAAFTVADRVARRDASLASALGEIGGYVHHLRNALTPVSMGLRHLDGAALDEEERQSLAAARRGVERSCDLLEKLLESVRQRAGPRDEGSFDVAELLAAVCASEERSSEARLVVADAAGGYRVQGNPEHLRLALENLVRNAAEAGAERVRLQLVAAEGEGAVLAVEDDGPGIPEPLLPTLFEAPISVGKPDGHGFGLYISRRLVELLGGSLTLARTGPTGARFEIRLPGARDGAPLAAAS